MYLIQVTTAELKQLEKSKLQLEAQLKDLEWRLDQESKVNIVNKG